MPSQVNWWYSRAEMTLSHSETRATHTEAGIRPSKWSFKRSGAKMLSPSRLSIWGTRSRSIKSP